MLLTAPGSRLSEVGIPALEAVLDATEGRGEVVLEVKNRPGEPDFDAPRERTTALLLDLLRARRGAGRRDDVVISSFDWFALDAVIADRDDPGWQGAPPRTGMLLLPGVTLLAGLSTAVESGYDEVHAPVTAVREGPQIVRRAHAVDRRVVAWTVTEPAEALEMRAAGVDAVICDDPAAVRRLLGA